MRLYPKEMVPLQIDRAIDHGGTYEARQPILLACGAVGPGDAGHRRPCRNVCV